MFRGIDAEIHLTEQDLEIVPLESVEQGKVEHHKMTLADVARVEDRNPSMLRKGYVRVLGRADLGGNAKDARTVRFGRDVKEDFVGLIQQLKGVAARNIAERPLEEQGEAPKSLDAAMAANEAAIEEQRMKSARRRAEIEARHQQRKAERRR